MGRTPLFGRKTLTFGLIAALSGAHLLLSACSNTCEYARDGECDEPEGTGLCADGTDTADCQAGTCLDTCAFANDGECDDGGTGSTNASCTTGTDCGDCGVR